MRVTDVFVDAGGRARGRFEEALWAQLRAEPVTRVDVGRRGRNLVVDVELAPGIDPRRVLVRREGSGLVLLDRADLSVLSRVPLESPVGRSYVRRTPNGLSVTAPLLSRAPVAVAPGLRPASRAGRLGAALRAALRSALAALRAPGRALAGDGASR